MLTSTMSSSSSLVGPASTLVSRWVTRRGLRRGVSLSLCLALAGCGASSDDEDFFPDDSVQGPATVSPGTTNGAGYATDPGGDLLASEPQVGGACASSVAAEVFTSALCSCEDARIAGYLRTRSFRSSDGPNAPEELGGSVGINRDYDTAGYADIGGSFTVAGSRDVRFAGYVNVGQDLSFNPAFDVAGVVDIERDAYLASAVRAFGRVGIGRDLHAAAGAGFRGIALVDVAGEEFTEAVSVAPPCACAPEQIIDVAALVDAAATDNDNAAVGLDEDDLNRVVGIGTELTLPAGRYYVNQLRDIGSLTLHVTGKVVLFVAGDLRATGLFQVDLDPDAELDVFVRDDLVVTGAASFGDSARPAATRIYVGGTGDIAIAGASAFVGNLYAPTADILLGGFGRVDGSLFGKNVTAAGFLSVGYDSSITEPGEGCPPVGPNDVPRIR